MIGFFKEYPRFFYISVILPIFFILSVFIYPREILAGPNDPIEVTMTPGCDATLCIDAQKLNEISCKMKNNQDIPTNHTIYFTIWPKDKTDANAGDSNYYSTADSKMGTGTYFKADSKGVTFTYLDPAKNPKVPDEYRWLKEINDFFKPFVPLHYECVLHDNTPDPISPTGSDVAFIQGDLTFTADKSTYINSTVTSANCNLTSANDALIGSCPVGSSVAINCNGTEPYNSNIFAYVWQGSNIEAEAKKNTSVSFGGSGGTATKIDVKVPFYYECVASQSDGRVGQTFSGSVGISTGDYLDISMTPNCSNNVCVDAQKLNEISCKMKNGQDIPAGYKIFFTVWPVSKAVFESYSMGVSGIGSQSYYTGDSKGVTFYYLDPAKNALVPAAYQWLILPKIINNTTDAFMPFVPLHYECALHKDGETDPNINLDFIPGDLNKNNTEPTHVNATLSSNSCTLNKNGEVWIWVCPSNSTVDFTCSGLDGYTTFVHTDYLEGVSNETDAKKVWASWAANYKKGISPVTRSGIKVPFYFECVGENAGAYVGKTFKGSVVNQSCLTSGDIKQDGLLNKDDFEDWKFKFLHTPRTNNCQATGTGSCKGSGGMDLIDFSIWRHFCQLNPNCKNTL